jgi:hypothetical protein
MRSWNAWAPRTGADGGVARVLTTAGSATSGADGTAAETLPPRCLAPYALRGLRLANRLVVSPMAQYMAQDGVPGEWHLVRLGRHVLDPHTIDGRQP